MKKILLIPMIILMLSLLCACGKGNDGADGEFYAVLTDNPRNLDPQMAEDKQSVFVIRNIYATLMDIDGSGRVVNGAAKSYTVSDDGLVYTFCLREGLCWQGLSGGGDIPLTAYDYEYAFRRIYSKKTMSPYTRLFSCVKNSMAVYRGEKDGEAIGVKAINDSTLRIELEYPNCDFLKLTAHTAASPCCERLFLSTQGRYGLSAADTWCCGAFYVSDWNYDPYWTDNHITLERISANSAEGYVTYPKKVNIEITDSRAENEKQKGYRTDAYTAQRYAEYDKETARSYSCREYISGTSCLFLSDGFLPVSDDGARKALLAAVDREKLAAALGEDSLPAAGLLPDCITVVNKSFRELFSVSENRLTALPYGWKSFAAEHPEADLNSSVLLVSDGLRSQSMPYSVISDFEEKLDFYCTAVFKSERDFDGSLSAGEGQLFIDTVRADFNLAENFTEQLRSRCGSRGKELNDCIKEMSRCFDINEKKEAVRNAEELITGGAYALPLSFEKEYLICQNGVSNIWYDPCTGAIFFKYAKKT